MFMIIFTFSLRKQYEKHSCVYQVSSFFACLPFKKYSQAITLCLIACINVWKCTLKGRIAI